MRLPLKTIFVSSVVLVSFLACRGATEPSSPHAFEIVYRGRLASSDEGFIVMNANGSEKRVLARPSHESVCPSLSPDGNRLVYAAATTHQIIVLDLSTGGETQLTQGTSWSDCPVWSPDGTRIAFFRGPVTSLNGFGLYVMRADGSDIRELASDGYTSGGIDWSPDGRWLAVTNIDFRLVLVDPATGNVGPVLTPTSIGYQANFSPDGREVAYNVESETGIDIYVSNLNGSGARRLTSSTGTPSYYTNPHWSPDGKLLTYWRYVVDTIPDHPVPAIFLLSRDGTPIAWENGHTIYGDQAFWRRSR